jgi:CRISPR/Cas system-associated exonuclease Cas4 (RecB family)
MSTKTIIEITENQLEDYIKCPNLFYIRHVNGILPRKQVTIRSIADKYTEQMFYSLMDGKIPNIDDITGKFTEECIRHKYPVIHRDVQKSISKLITLFNWLISNRVRIGDVGSPYELTFPSANVIVKGKFDIVRYMDDKLELLITDLSNRDPNQDLIDISIRYTLQAYAVHKLITKYELSCVHVLGIRYNRVQELFSYRSPTDYARVENTIKNVAAAIRENIFYPRESYECSYCPVRAFCGGVLNYVDIGVKNAD